MSIYAKVLASSSGPSGSVVTTLECRFPRCILAQVRTYGMLSYSVRSSRAVPVATMIKEVEDNPFMPKEWRYAQKGMIAGDVANADDEMRASDWWAESLRSACKAAKDMAAIGIAKQHVNRLLEPFAWSYAVITGTSDEWLWLLKQRLDDSAQPEFQELAKAIFSALYRGQTVHDDRDVGEWHLPYIAKEEFESCQRELLPAISAARCARVSYKPFDMNSSNIDRDIELSQSLWKDKHLSPFEHQAMACATGAYHAKLSGFMSYRTWKGY